MAKGLNEKVEDLRLKGNECVKAANFAEAILHYSHGIKLDPSVPQLFSNRSYAFLKLKHFHYALEDAKETIRLEPNWGKGYFRKAEVEYATQHYEDALDSYCLASHILSDPILSESVTRTKNALIIQKKYEKKVPWVGAGMAFILGVMLVVADAIFPKAPVFKHPVIQGIVVMAISLAGLVLGKCYKWYIVSQRRSLLEPPPDLLGGCKAHPEHREENGVEDTSQANQEEKKPHTRYSKAQARQRYKKGKS